MPGMEVRAFSSSVPKKIGSLQELFDQRRRDLEGFFLAFGNARAGLAADRADLPLQVAHAGLARVFTNDLVQGLVAEVDLLGRSPFSRISRGIRYCLAIAIFSLSVYPER